MKIIYGNDILATLNVRNPFTGGINNNNMSYDEDSCVVHGMWTGGVFILDPTRVVSLIPAILAA